MKNRMTMAMLAGIAVAIMAGAVLAQPSITAMAASHDTNTTANNNGTGESELTTFEEEELRAEQEDTMNTTAASVDNATMPDDMMMEEEQGETGPSQASGAGDEIVVQGTASSPGPQAGPFQVIDLLPPMLDGNVYVGWVSFTASKPILVAPLHSYGVANQTLDPEFGELFVFPGIPNGTMIAPALTMPDYATQEELSVGIPTPETFSATVPFTGNGISVGRLDGEQFLVSYTVFATVHPAQTVDNVESAVMNVTEVEGTEAIIPSGAAFLNETAYQPNPIQIEEGDTVTWVNKDFDPHTVTSGAFGDEDAGDEFDSGYMGPQASFSFTFEDSGEFEYFCELHPNMVGTVEVD